MEVGGKAGVLAVVAPSGSEGGERRGWMVPEALTDPVGCRGGFGESNR